MSLKKSFLGAVLALALGGVIATAVSSGTVLSLFTQAIIYAVFALGVGVLLKQNGMVSFGHALFFGGASYLVGILLQLQLMSAELAILAALLIVTVSAFLIGLVVGIVRWLGFRITEPLCWLYVEFVRNTPGAIGYIDAADVKPGLNVVFKR